MAVLTATPTTTEESERDCWRTPPDLFARLDKEYGQFDIDAAATATSALCSIWLGPGSDHAEDALAGAWTWGRLTDWRYLDTGRVLRVFLNPPYSRCKAFVEKAAWEAQCGHARTTLLLPATTDVQWWHRLVWDNAARRFRPGVEVEFLKRVKFLRPDGSSAGGPTFGSVVVTFLA